MPTQSLDLSLLSTGQVTESTVNEHWYTLRREAMAAIASDCILERPVGAAVLAHSGLAQALAHRIAQKLGDDDLSRHDLLGLAAQAFLSDPSIVGSAAVDLAAVRDRDPAIGDLLTPFLHFKGFLALQSHRVAHWLWNGGRKHAARHLQSRCSEILDVDIHPAVVMGKGIMLDHGSGIVIGETAVVEDDVSILQDVTLGGTGKHTGDRHPKVRRGALIGAGAKILGNIEIGIGAKVGAGSVVVNTVANYTTVVGVPARPIGGAHANLPGITMDQALTEPDYVI